MPSLREFLEKEAQNQDQRERIRRRDEWVASVTRLINQFRTWLQEADTPGLLTILTEEVERAEEGMPMYKVPALKIHLGGRYVSVTPVSRNVVGHIDVSENARVRAQGRIDISNGGERHILYRSLADGEERWYALDDRYKVSLLDRDRFEAIVRDLLS